MAGALLVDARSGEDSVTLLVVAETAAQSLVRAFEEVEKAERLRLPQLVPPRPNWSQWREKRGRALRVAVRVL